MGASGPSHQSPSGVARRLRNVASSGRSTHRATPASEARDPCSSVARWMHTGQHGRVRLGDGTERRLGSATFVVVMQAADVRD